MSLLSSLLDSDSEENQNPHSLAKVQGSQIHRGGILDTLHEAPLTELRHRAHYTPPPAPLPAPPPQNADTSQPAARDLKPAMTLGQAHKDDSGSTSLETPVSSHGGRFKNLRTASIARLGGLFGPLRSFVSSASKAQGDGEGSRGRGAARRTLDDSLLSARVPFSLNGIIMRRRWGLQALFEWLNSQLALGDDESLLVVIAIFVPFLIDVSLITSALPLAFLLYSLLAQVKGRAFWHGCLVYLEAVLIAQYTFQVLRCAALSDPSSEWYYAFFGLHFSPIKDVPLFLCYLTVLFHTYRLSQVKSPSIQQTNQRAKAIISNLLPQNVSSLWAKLGKAAFFEAVKFFLRVVKVAWEILRVYRFVLLPHELSPQWIKVEISWPHSAMRRPARPPPRHRHTSSLDSRPFQPLSIEITEDEILTMEEGGTKGEEGGASSSAFSLPHEPSGMEGLDPPPPSTLLSSSSSLSAQESEALILIEAALRDSPHAGPIEWLHLTRVHHMTPHLTGSTLTSVLIEVKVKSHLDHSLNAHAFSSPVIPRPAKLAADAINAKVLRDEADEDPAPFTPFVPRPSIISAASYSSPPPDFYTSASLLDLLFIIYMALCYQTILFSSLSSYSSSDDLSEAANNGLPLSFLLVLMSLSALLIVERVVYTAGHHATKLFLHVTLTILSLSLGIILLWRPLFWWSLVNSTSTSTSIDSVAPEPSAAAKIHIRMLLLIRISSLTLSALQLRCGWPKQSSRFAQLLYHMILTTFMH